MVDDKEFSGMEKTLTIFCGIINPIKDPIIEIGVAVLETLEQKFKIREDSL